MSDRSEVSERDLERALDQWTADEPSSDFAARIAQKVSQGGTRSARAGRSVVVPLFLAAIFVSLGAAAAWDTWARPVLTVEVERGADPAAKRQIVSLKPHSQIVSAERDQEAAEQGSLRPQLRKVAAPEAAEQVDEEPPTPPRVVHVPRCECGTSGVVCSCAE
jgi:hypothetical protein